MGLANWFKSLFAKKRCAMSEYRQQQTEYKQLIDSKYGYRPKAGDPERKIIPPKGGSGTAPPRSERSSVHTRSYSPPVSPPPPTYYDGGTDNLAVGMLIGGAIASSNSDSSPAYTAPSEPAYSPPSESYSSGASDFTSDTGAGCSSGGDF